MAELILINLKPSNLFCNVGSSLIAVISVIAHAVLASGIKMLEQKSAPQRNVTLSFFLVVVQTGVFDHGSGQSSSGAVQTRPAIAEHPSGFLESISRSAAAENHFEVCRAKSTLLWNKSSQKSDCEGIWKSRAARGRSYGGNSWFWERVGGVGADKSGA